jgi:alkylresorcinol/alkylpyrone synthase
VRIASVAKALPPHAYDQQTLVDHLREAWKTKHHNPARLEQVHKNVLVGGRHLALRLEEYAELRSFGAANDAWIRVAQQIGGEAVRDALSAAEVDRRDLGAFFFTTVTGVATPSIEARLMNRLQLPPNLRRIPLFGLGCVAGAAGVARAADYLKAWPEHAAILLSVELCSLTVQQEDLSIPNLIATGLFGDGAAAVVMVGEAHPRAKAARGPRVRATKSVFYPDTERVMGWDISERGFKIVLSAEVPEVVRRNVRADVQQFLAEQGVRLDQIGSYVCHPGGPKVLEAFEDALELAPGALDLTWKSLREFGNLSSTSVLFVLADTIGAPNRPPPGTLGLMMAMGPAFCLEMVLFEW